MSLRHLYRDLNSLGIYPDVIDIVRSGECNKIMYKDIYSKVIVYNKYYGYRTYIYDWGGIKISRKMTEKSEDVMVITYFETWEWTDIHIKSRMDEFRIKRQGSYDYESKRIWTCDGKEFIPKRWVGRDMMNELFKNIEEMTRSDFMDLVMVEE